MGKPGDNQNYCRQADILFAWREPGEVKHLSTRRKRKQFRLWRIHSLSSGERKGRSLNVPLPTLPSIFGKHLPKILESSLLLLLTSIYRIFKNFGQMNHCSIFLKIF